ncbi:serine/threonine-protein phosphatase [Planomonospora sp. ID91781]|uniref:Serine/threonine protein phosphatase PstP n=1 Tax=Planomonospora sphaerica TaxID=161355 RepID=A0A161LUN3_9ACTN|nr:MULTISPECIES: protein phosphatase 2C domain-containing protein [Planomonospora]MBG0821127.1 serine/threonine-protein phosphatase [Planomonospora sp. ID91781]GAT65341.1 protein phosphatase [Planomonospora sphaerica]
MITLRYAAGSDVGRVRQGNEDSAYAGPRLLAVADGMGGHVGGEVASAAAVATVAPLDHECPPDLVAAAENGVHRANRRLREMVEQDPSLTGMGTTLTLMLWDGPRVALAHIGDSRAYLLREGDLYQITYDHTLVQTLMDDGRITAEEAARHPHRSILLQVLDGSDTIEVDLSLRDAEVGDRYLLCSDGLSGVVDADRLRHVLATIDDLDTVTRTLIELACDAGGPDNITCVVADVIDEPGPAQDAPVIVGAAAP